jgi:membrane protease YdiL (CAAX protease family)
MLVTVGVGVAGGIAPINSSRSQRRVFGWFAAVMLGTAPFILVAATFQPHTAQWGGGAIAASFLVAVAEELFFRRLVYGWLERWGPLVAILGSAIAFAAVHLPGWGLELFPVNVAAGVILGWQRRATGGWSASAVSHAIANLLAMGLIL